MKVLYFDLETAPCKGWFWRPGFRVRLTMKNVREPGKIICASWKWKGKKKVHRADWGKDKDDKLVLEPLVEAMNEADLIIAHNGDRFDIRWVRARCLANGIMSLPRWQTMDTLKSLRANLELPSYRLEDVCEYYDLPYKKMKVDGDLWEEIVFGEGERMEEMLEYCDADILALESVHEFIEKVVPSKMHVGVAEGGEKWSCNCCGSEHVKHHMQRTTKTGIIKHSMKCKNCGSYYTINGVSYINYLKHRIKKGV